MRFLIDKECLNYVVVLATLNFVLLFSLGFNLPQTMAYAMSWEYIFRMN